MNHALQFKALKYRVFCIQMLSILVFASGCWFYQGLYASLSACLGGVIGIVPVFLFASFYPSHLSKMQAKSVVKRLYWGETVKWLVTVLLFILAFQWSNLQGAYFFVSFIIAQFVYVIVSLVSSS
jgi:ATP synthase protein I